MAESDKPARENPPNPIRKLETTQETTTENLQLTPPSEEGVSEKDSKFKTFTELIHKGFKKIGEPLTWGPAEGKQLKNLIRAAPWMSEQQFRTCLTNWHKSPSTNISDPPCLWLSKLPRYLNGPLDQFNRPLAPPPRPQATAEENLVE